MLVLAIFPRRGKMAEGVRLLHASLHCALRAAVAALRRSAALPAPLVEPFGFS